jgi:Alpha/beta hydrolase family
MVYLLLSSFLTIQLFGSKTSLRTLSRQLAASIPTEVYTLDLRNHGESAKQGELPHSYELMASDVAQFIADHSLNNVVLAGHSMYLSPEKCLFQGRKSCDVFGIDETGGCNWSDFIRECTDIKSFITYISKIHGSYESYYRGEIY